ncbi:MAG: hypothetical protein M3R38_25940 [Actinomycetota bacterium]|nr:hypothetical protein [Actinomycetota bacterium]
MRRDGDETTTGRYTVHEAAMMLGLSVDAVRKRAERGTLKREKGEDGAVYVLLDSTQTGQRSNVDSSGDETATGQRLVAVLESQVEHLKRELEVRNEELRRKDTIIMTLAQRVPELVEAPQDGQDGAQRPADTNGGVEEVGERGTEPQRASWWARWFGG